MFSKEFGSKPDVAVSNKYQTQLKKSFCCRVNPEAATVGVFCKRRPAMTSTDVFLWILQNVEEHLFWKTSVNRCFWKSAPQWQIYRREVIPEFYYPFKPFSILNFAKTEWFCYATCFAKVFLLFFFSLQHDIFVIVS